MQEFEVNCRKLKSAMKPITYKKIPRYVVLSILFLTILLGFRWIWSETFTIPAHPEPIEGLLDLRDWDLANTSPISLDGEWEFYPQTLISNRDAKIADNPSTPIQVPGDWRDALPQSSSSFGYGTYRLRILLDPSVEEVSLGSENPDIIDYRDERDHCCRIRPTCHSCRSLSTRKDCIYNFLCA